MTCSKSATSTSATAGTSAHDDPIVRGVNLTVGAGEVVGHRRRVRLRQVDAGHGGGRAARPAGADSRGPGPLPTGKDLKDLSARRAASASPGRDLDGVPGIHERPQPGDADQGTVPRRHEGPRRSLRGRGHGPRQGDVRPGQAPRALPRCLPPPAERWHAPAGCDRLGPVPEAQVALP